MGRQVLSSPANESDHDQALREKPAARISNSSLYPNTPFLSLHIKSSHVSNKIKRLFRMHSCTLICYHSLPGGQWHRLINTERDKDVHLQHLLAFQHHPMHPQDLGGPGVPVDRSSLLDQNLLGLPRDFTPVSHLKYEKQLRSVQFSLSLTLCPRRPSLPGGPSDPEGPWRAHENNTTTLEKNLMGVTCESWPI